MRYDWRLIKAVFKTADGLSGQKRQTDARHSDSRVTVRKQRIAFGFESSILEEIPLRYSAPFMVAEVRS